jgi:hypothetical protein
VFARWRRRLRKLLSRAGSEGGCGVLARNVAGNQPPETTTSWRIKGAGNFAIHFAVSQHTGLHIETFDHCCGGWRHCQNCRSLCSTRNKISYHFSFSLLSKCKIFQNVFWTTHHYVSRIKREIRTIQFESMYTGSLWMSKINQPVSVRCEFELDWITSEQVPTLVWICMLKFALTVPRWFVFPLLIVCVLQASEYACTKVYSICEFQLCSATRDGK